MIVIGEVWRFYLNQMFKKTLKYPLKNMEIDAFKYIYCCLYVVFYFYLKIPQKILFSVYDE